jgi:P4 family phage/plasmid primase-like protien
MSDQLDNDLVAPDLFDPAIGELPTQAAPRFARAGMSIFPVDMRPDENGQARKQPLPGYAWKQRATSVMSEVVEDFVAAEHDIGAEFVGIAWALGLDGKLGLDRDTDPPEWWGQLTRTAINPTKRGDHWIYDQPPGRRIGNGTSRFPSQGWGEVRGVGGYIVIWWSDRPGFDVAELGRIVDFSHPEWLTDASDVEAPGCSPSELEVFKNTHTVGQVGRIKGFETKLAARLPGSSRNAWAVVVACWIAREAAADLTPAREAFEALERWWSDLRPEPDADGKLKTRKLSRSEILRVERWAIGQLTLERVEEVRAKAEAERSAWEAEQKAEREALDGMFSQPPKPGSFDLNNANDWNDSLLGQELADELRPDWRHVTAWRQWVRWDGRRWATDETEAVHEVARRWMLRLGGKVLSKVTSSKDPRLRKVLDYRRAAAMENVVKVARRILAVEPTVFDTDAHLLNAQNGVVDLRTGQLGPHDPALMMTRLAGAAYDPAARHPDVICVFGCVAQGDVTSMKMLLGVAATGHTGGDHLPVWDGTGGNGKTTLLLAASAALGDYAGPVPPELVMKSNREDHPTIKTALQGLRLAYIEETEEDGGLRLERVKAITGGAPITGRKIGGNYYTFSPSHTLVLATNHRPNVNSAEHAAWRRLHLIPFPHRYGTASGDKPIDAGLRDRVRLGRKQRETMLAVIVAGAKAAYTAGEPDSPVVCWSAGIDAATDAWRADEDVIWRFAESQLDFGSPDARTTLKVMFDQYRWWCEAGNRQPGQDKLFARRFESHDVFRSHGVERINSHGSVVYVGVRFQARPLGGPGGDTPRGFSRAGV